MDLTTDFAAIHRLCPEPPNQPQLAFMEVPPAVRAAFAANYQSAAVQHVTCEIKGNQYVYNLTYIDNDHKSHTVVLNEGGGPRSIGISFPGGFNMSKKALIVSGGWDGHHPVQIAELFQRVLTEDGFIVEKSDTLDAFKDEAKVLAFDLVIPNWTMGKITSDQANGVISAVRAGVGIAGCHGGLCDAFRENTEWQFHDRRTVRFPSRKRRHRIYRENRPQPQCHH